MTIVTSHPQSKSMISILPSATNSVLQVFLSHLFAAREITSRDLGINLHSRIGGDEVFRNIIALQNRYTALEDCIIFPAAGGGKYVGSVTSAIQKEK